MKEQRRELLWCVEGVLSGTVLGARLAALAPKWQTRGAIRDRLAEQPNSPERVLI